MDQAQSPIVDFHSHFVGPSLPLTTLKGLCGPQRAAWERINARLTDAGALLASLEQGGIAARIISSPPEFIEDAGGNVPQDGYRRVNDAVADLVGKHPGRLYGLASVDAYGGEPSARELERGVRQLGLRGVFMPSAKGDLLPDAEAARPTLAAAAALQIPVFLHPVADGQLFARFKRFGPLGMRLTRGTINSAALFAIIESGLFEELPNLRVVVTALALGGLLLAGTVGDGAKLHARTPPPARRHVYIDTTGVHPAVIRSAVELLGADHVLMGTDWPVVAEDDVGGRLQAALAAGGLGERERSIISGGNALRLLGIDETARALSPLQ